MRGLLQQCVAAALLLGGASGGSVPCDRLVKAAGCEASWVLDGCAPECDAVLREDPEEEHSESAKPGGTYCCHGEEEEEHGHEEHHGEGRRVLRRLEDESEEEKVEGPTCASPEKTEISALSIDFGKEEHGEEEHHGEGRRVVRRLEDTHEADTVTITYTKEGEHNTTECKPEIEWDAEEQKITFKDLDETCHALELDHASAFFHRDENKLIVSVNGTEISLGRCISEEEEEHEQFIVATMILVILVVLVVVSIFFEWSTEAFQDYLEEHMPESVPVLKTIMKELTILGFLGLLAFLANKSGILGNISAQLFEDTKEGREELPEVFENIHMTLFFVMALFLMMGAVLVVLLEVHEKRLRLYGRLAHEQTSQLLSEYLIKNLGYTERGLTGAAPADQESVMNPSAQFSLRRMFGCHKEIASKTELAETVHFFAMQVRFIRTFGRQGGALNGEGLQVTNDFDFAEYLANAQAETAEDLIELTLGTWAMLAVFFLGVYGVMLIDMHDEKETAKVQVAFFIAFGYFNTLVSLYISHYMYSMQKALTIPIRGEKGETFLLRQYRQARAREGVESNLAQPPAVSTVGSIQDEGTPLMGNAVDRSQNDENVIEPSYTTDLLSPDMKAFMRSVSDPNSCLSGHSCRKHGLPSKHRLLFGKTLARFGQGPHFVLFLVRYVMLLTAIHLAMLVVFVAEYILANLPLPWLWIIVAALPAPYGMLIRPASMVALWCRVCKIEQLADAENVKNVLDTMRDRRVVAAIKMIGAMAEARRLEDANKDGAAKKVLKVPVPSTPMERTLEQERRRNDKVIFDTFDTSGDGQLDPDEFKRLMEAVGTSLDATQIDNMITEIELMTEEEGQGDGEISFEEFHNYMEARAAAEETSEERMQFLFGIFDADGDGDITMEEFTKKMKEVCTTLTDSELAAVCRDCDQDHDGTITISEFSEWIEKFSE